MRYMTEIGRNSSPSASETKEPNAVCPDRIRSKKRSALGRV